MNPNADHVKDSTVRKVLLIKPEHHQPRKSVVTLVFKKQNPQPMLWHQQPCQGEGVYPDVDPFGRPFDRNYEPGRAALAGTRIMGPYVAVLEGVQADQDFCRVAFHLQNYYSKKQCCHYCGVIQWTSRYPAPGEPNDPSDLYTNFSEDQNRGNPSCKIDNYAFHVSKACFHLGLQWTIQYLSDSLHPRIVDLATFVAINGPSPLCNVVGFSPDSDLIQELSGFYGTFHWSHPKITLMLGPKHFNPNRAIGLPCCIRNPSGRDAYPTFELIPRCVLLHFAGPYGQPANHPGGI